MSGSEVTAVAWCAAVVARICALVQGRRAWALDISDWLAEPVGAGPRRPAC